MEDVPAAAADLRERLSRAERERDEYQAEVHALTERVRTMTSAASSAAASTVTAIERIQQMDVVVKAAQSWRTYEPQIAVGFTSPWARLLYAVDAYTDLERNRS